MSRLTVLAYDIACNQRRRRVARLCEQRMLRVQESVFEAWLTSAEGQRLLDDLRPHLDLSQDQVRLYPLALRHLQRRQVIGLMPRATPTPDYYLV